MTEEKIDCIGCTKKENFERQQRGESPRFGVMGGLKINMWCPECVGFHRRMAELYDVFDEA